jgi:ABC-2 type transport system ATP-binding protein
MSQQIVEVRDFTKKYGDFTAVENISFTVEKGEIFGLLGPNGAGKTSTLESLEGLRPPSNGSLTVAGVDPSKDTRKLRNIIGVQLQSAGLPDNITPKEAMRFFCAYHEVEPDIALLKRLGLGEKLDTQFHQLSTGQQRRLSLALAIAHKPEVLFLDEPTAGLDVNSRVELHKLMQELKSDGATIIMATHDMAEAEENCDRLAILLNGQIETIGTPMEITSTGAGLTKISVRTESSSLGKDAPDFKAVEQKQIKKEYHIYFSTNISHTLTEVIAYIESNNDNLIDLRVERPSLEDRFIEITENGENK